MTRERLSARRPMLAGILVAALALGGCQSTGQGVMLGAAIGAGVGGVAVVGRQTGEGTLAAGTAIGDAITGQDPAARAPRSRDDDYEYEYVLVGALIGGLVGWLIGNKRINKASGGAGGGLALGAQEAALNMEYPSVHENLALGDWKFSQVDQGVGYASAAASAGGKPHSGDIYDGLIRLNGRTTALAECLRVLNPRKREKAPQSAGNWRAESYDASLVGSSKSDVQSTSDSTLLE